jgi:hypothetical protein
LVNCPRWRVELCVSSELQQAKPAPRPMRDAVARPFLRRPALYPELYSWYVFASALDVLFTWRILQAHGTEVNVVADWIIQHHDLPGLAVFKFATVVLVLLICEVVGRRRYETGAKLARWAVALSAFPVVIGAAHLLRIAFGVIAVVPGPE